MPYPCQPLRISGLLLWREVLVALVHKKCAPAFVSLFFPTRLKSLALTFKPDTVCRIEPLTACKYVRVGGAR